MEQKPQNSKRISLNVLALKQSTVCKSTLWGDEVKKITKTVHSAIHHKKRPQEKNKINNAVKENSVNKQNWPLLTPSPPPF